MASISNKMEDKIEYTLIVKEQPKPKKVPINVLIAENTPDNLPEYKIFYTIEDFRKEMEKK